jgi:hypothetical protein
LWSAGWNILVSLMPGFNVAALDKNHLSVGHLCAEALSQAVGTAFRAVARPNEPAD